MAVQRKKTSYFGYGIEKLGEGKEQVEWDWEHFSSTKGFPVNKNLLLWIIGQDEALNKSYLALDEWLHKLKWMKEEGWFKSWEDPNEAKFSKKMIPPGPYILLLGDPGTGKSLLGRALANHLSTLYEREGINLYDVLCWQNESIPSEPRISCHLAGEARNIVRREKLKYGKKKRFLKWGFRFLQGMMIGFGLFILGTVMGLTLYNWIVNVPFYPAAFAEPILIQEYFHGNFLSYFIGQLLANASLLYLGIGSLSMGAMLFLFKNLLGRGFGSTKGISGAEQTEAPKLIVDNSEKIAPFIDSTGHKVDQLFGSLTWDPFQSGGLGTPENQRTTAGDVHRANLGILYIDEIKNLHPEEAITLLTVLEEGSLPITLRGSWTGGGSSAMVISTEPIPCLTFLIGAGNFDSINQIHPALMDRLIGYGKVIRMNNDMPNTVENRRKYVQFIAQESTRFHLPSFTRDACKEIVEEGRRRSGKKDSLTTKFRPLISIIKTAGTLARNENKMVEVTHIKTTIQNHCKTIQRQILEESIKEKNKVLEINPHGVRKGIIYGLAVNSDQALGEMIGTVLRVKGQICKKKKNLGGYYKVTGITKNATWIDDSIAKVRSVLIQKYSVDIAQEYFTHIDFSQEYGIDGPSAGVTMAILLSSLIEGKSLKQDVAVTGEINVSSTSEVEITAIGGIHEKIKAAEMWGFKKVVIPQKNLEHSIKISDYKIKVVGASTLDEYLKEVLTEDEEVAQR